MHVEQGPKNYKVACRCKLILSLCFTKNTIVWLDEPSSELIRSHLEVFPGTRLS